jgi:hypothetical protein
MKKLLMLAILAFLVPGCAILTELTALTRCEFSFHSARNPTVCGIDVSTNRSFTDFSFTEGQLVVANILRGTLPFSITANVEVRNPGTMTAAVNSMEWIAFIDEVQVAQGIINDRIEVAPSGGSSIIPVRIRTDLFDYLEGDNPRTMINFALNLIDAGNQPTRLSMKIKPSVYIGGQSISYPGFFTISKEFSSGN